MEMIGAISKNRKAINSEARRKRASSVWLIWFLFIIGLTISIATVLVLNQAAPATIAWLLFVGGAMVILYEPRYGFYLTVFATLLGDQVLLPWYPFTKNFSSAESLLYTNESLIFNPLEVYLILTLIVWLIRSSMLRKIGFFFGSLFWPMVIFASFIAMGLIYGISTGGNLNVALWESRSIFYLPLMLILTSNLIKTKGQINVLVWGALISLVILGIIGVCDFLFEQQGQISRLMVSIEHGATIRISTVFLLVLAGWLYRASISKRLLLPLLAMPCLVTYFVAQRRAAFVTLAFAIVLIVIVLFRENRRAFWQIVPPIVLIALMYIGLFWNSQDALGLPARAIKTIISPNSGTAQEMASSIYRIIENYDISYTIHNTNPLTGVGFGQKFIAAITLPDISWFVWYQYIPHNSILYIWMKAGILAFLALLTLIGMTIITGVRTILIIQDHDLKAVGLTALLYVVMHFIFAYVDMSWDAINMVYLGMMIGLLNRLDRMAIGEKRIFRSLCCTSHDQSIG
jgi:hypothetical protein